MEQQIFNYLMKNCIGKENRIKGCQLQQVFEIEDNSTFRYYIRNLRKTNELIITSISGKNGGYFIASTENEAIEGEKSFDKRARQTFKVRSDIKHKRGLNNQFRLFNKKSVFKSILRSLGGN